MVIVELQRSVSRMQLADSDVGRQEDAKEDCQRVGERMSESD
jgi:hypothetical protein